MPMLNNNKKTLFQAFELSVFLSFYLFEDVSIIEDNKIIFHTFYVHLCITIILNRGFACAANSIYQLYGSHSFFLTTNNQCFLGLVRFEI